MSDEVGFERIDQPILIPRASEQKWDLNLIPNQTGRIALVTGAAGISSIGINIAHQLALKGAKVYLGARTAEKAETAISTILSLSSTVSKDQLKPFIAELDDLKQVQAACERLLEDESRMDILIHNAAIGPGPVALDSNGLSLFIVVNHLAPFNITKMLLPLLKAAAAQSSDVRVVTVSSRSQAFLPGPIRFDSKESFKYDAGGADDSSACLYRYAHSKLANVLFAYQLQKRLDAEGIDILSLSLHPGTAKTAGAIDFITKFGAADILKRAITPMEGAITPLFAAVAPEVRREKATYGGAYLMPFGKVSPEDMSDDAKNPALAEELWDTSERIVAELLNYRFGNE